MKERKARDEKLKRYRHVAMLYNAGLTISEIAERLCITREIAADRRMRYYKRMPEEMAASTRVHKFHRKELLNEVYARETAKMEQP